MQSEQYRKITDIVSDQRKYYPDNPVKKVDWEGSPFEWIINVANSPQKGKIGKKIVKEFLQSYGFAVFDRRSQGSDMTVNGLKVKVKSSTLWENGTYKFQQIKKQDFDILFCLGISPNAAHAWVVWRSDIVWGDKGKQHGGEKGQGNTWWISFIPPNCPYEWMKPNNGDLSKVCEELKKITRK